MRSAERHAHKRSLRWGQLKRAAGLFWSGVPADFCYRGGAAATTPRRARILYTAPQQLRAAFLADTPARSFATDRPTCHLPPPSLPLCRARRSATLATPVGVPAGNTDQQSPRRAGDGKEFPVEEEHARSLPPHVILQVVRRRRTLPKARRTGGGRRAPSLAGGIPERDTAPPRQRPLSAPSEPEDGPPEHSSRPARRRRRRRARLLPTAFFSGAFLAIGRVGPLPRAPTNTLSHPTL